MNVDVQRLLEKYYADIRHIETERHWFLAAFAVAVAGTLAFLAQKDNQSSLVFGFAVLTILSTLGFLQCLRSAWVIELLQKETRDIVDLWRKNTNTGDVIWRERWKWPQSRDLTPTSRWWKDLLPNGSWPPVFTSIVAWTYLLAFGVFLYLLLDNWF